MHPGDEPEAKRRRESSNIAIQEITDELRPFGAVVGPKSTHCATQEVEGIEISELDLKDSVVSDIFCKSRFTSRAPRFGLHPGFAIDFSTGWHFDETDQKAEALKRRETMRLKLLVGLPECQTWCQLQNIWKDNQLFAHFSRHLEAVYHSQGTESLEEWSVKGFSCIFRGKMVFNGSATSCVPQG